MLFSDATVNEYRNLKDSSFNSSYIKLSPNEHWQNSFLGRMQGWGSQEQEHGQNGFLGMTKGGWRKKLHASCTTI